MFSSKAFLTRFHEFSRRKLLIQDRNRIIAAVSGGVDSVVLLDLLAREQEAFGLTIIVAHFNFQLRGAESDGDEHYVAQRARHYGYELYVERADAAEFARHYRIGLQEAARNLRYEFFDKLLLSSGFDRIATAHNADDNAETVLLNLYRGSGVAGFAGIPVYREDRRIIRPLLFAERHEIEAYAKAEGLPYRNDSSNAKDYYTRNFIRHNILPLVKDKINPDVVRTVNRSAELFRELETFLASTARQSFELVVTKDSNQELQLSVPRLRNNPALIQQYVIMQAARHFNNEHLEYADVVRILDLTEGLSGTQVTVSKNCAVFRNREHIVFRRPEEVQAFKLAVEPNKQYHFGHFSFNSEIIETNGTLLNGKGVEYVDADKIGAQELVLRSWKDGDAFVPLGMSTKKKVSDFFVDEKIPIYEKPLIPILETKDGEIVCVCGYRIDDRFRITRDTRRALKFQFSTTNNTNGTK
jgi:tRNA(Ile)-lysidine synthase